MVTTFSLMQLTIFPFWMIPCAHKSIIMIILVNIFQTVKRKKNNTKVAFFGKWDFFISVAQVMCLLPSRRPENT